MFDLLLQVTGSLFGLYKCYGNQPLMILGAPAWWFSIDAEMLILTRQLDPLRDILALPAQADLPGEFRTLSPTACAATRPPLPRRPRAYLHHQGTAGCAQVQHTIG